MEHNLHTGTPLHWGYGAAALPATPHNHWAPPPQSHGLKRAMSESDCEELYSEESSKEQISPSEPGSCQLMSRKKRRGVIEKKRRDRINSSLSELKRLVPSAYEKQGSAKLEKAEILQLTVEHLKNLQSKGIDSFSYDPQRFAMDYHIIGFRECAAEVARYLVTIEGMDIQDPLRLRLMSHLQYFVQQRELSVKSCASPGSWTPTPTPSAYQPNCTATPYQSYAATSSAAHAGITSSYVPNLPTPIHTYPTLSSSPASNVHQQQQTTPIQVNRSNSASGTSVNEALPIMTHAPTAQSTPQQQHQTQPTTSHVQQTPASHETHHQQQQQQQHYPPEHTHQDQQGVTYTDLTSAQAQSHSTHRNAPPAVVGGGIAYAGTAQYPASGVQEYNANYVAANGAKPYRPWGAEMAY